MILAPSPVQQFFSNDGRPAVNFRLFTYVAGTSTKIATYQDSTGLSSNTNPIVLDFRGECDLWLDPTLTYKFVFAPPGSDDPPTSAIWTVDNVAGLGGLTQAIIGQLLWPRTAGEIAASITPATYAYQPQYAERQGATEASLDAANKTALQSAISAGRSHELVIVQPGISYGYKLNDLTTYPSFSGLTAPCIVQDLGPGKTYAGYPAAYDGAQWRLFFGTPQTTAALTFTAGLLAGATSATLTANWTGTTGPIQVTFSNGDVRYVTVTNGATTATWTGGLSGAATTSATYINAGQHDGNTFRIFGDWAPAICIHNTANLSAVGSGTRTIFDNRRALCFSFVDGEAAWGWGQGSNSGATLTDEEMSNFAIFKFAIAGDTLGTSTPLVLERKTLNWGFNAGTNSPQASFYFKSAVTGFYQAVFESLTGTSQAYFRTSAGSSQDAGIRNVAGDLSLNIVAQGDGLTVRGSDRRVTVNQTLCLTAQTVTYSASMTINAATGNIFTITATNGTAFTINAPTNPSTGAKMRLRIRNASGGALGAITWNAVFKMAAFTSPANGFSRAIDWDYDGTNWVMASQSAADVPN